MKKFNRYTLFLLLFFISAIALGAKIGDNDLRVGDTTGSDIQIQMGEGRLKWDSATSKLQFSNDSGASLKEIGSGGGAAAGVNLLENADFETGSPPDNWTESAGSFLAETTAPGFDLQSGKFNSSAASQNLDSDFQAVPPGLEGRHCNATIQYKYAAGSSGDYKFQVVANTGGLLTEKDLDVATTWTSDQLSFDCPTTDSIKIRITSTVDGGDLLIDNATLGRTGFANVSQAELVASAYYAPTTSCQWTRTSASFGDFGVDADCPSITVESSTHAVDTADNDLPDIDFNYLPPGTYEVSVNFTWFHASTGTRSEFRISDGITNGATLSNQYDVEEQNTTVKAVFTYAVGGARNFKLQALNAATAQISLSSNVHALKYVVKRFPSSTAEAITLETIGEHWDVSIGGASPSLGTGSSSSYIEFPNGGLDMVINSNSKTAEIPCSSTNPSTGLTCSAGLESPGIVIDIASPGRYKACAEFMHNIQLNASASNTILESIFQWVETPNNAQTILQEGNSRIQSGYRQDDASGSAGLVYHPIHLCGTFTFTSPGQKTLRLMYEQLVTGAGGDITSNLVRADRNASLGQRDIHITVDKLDQQMPTPVFTDLNNSLDVRPISSAANTRIESAQVACDSTPQIDELGNWIDSVTWNGVGDCSINLDSTLWSDNPYCVVTNQSGTGNIARISGAITTSVVRVNLYDDTGASQDSNIQITCHGAR